MRHDGATIAGGSRSGSAAPANLAGKPPRTAAGQNVVEVQQVRFKWKKNSATSEVGIGGQKREDVFNLSRGGLPRIGAVLMLVRYESQACD